MRQMAKACITMRRAVQVGGPRFKIIDIVRSAQQCFLEAMISK